MAWESELERPTAEQFSGTLVCPWHSMEGSYRRLLAAGNIGGAIQRSPDRVGHCGLAPDDRRSLVAHTTGAAILRHHRPHHARATDGTAMDHGARRMGGPSVEPSSLVVGSCVEGQGTLQGKIMGRHRRQHARSGLLEGATRPPRGIHDHSPQHISHLPLGLGVGHGANRIASGWFDRPATTSCSFRPRTVCPALFRSWPGLGGSVRRGALHWLHPVLGVGLGVSGH
jgi:hypothetical protein